MFPKMLQNILLQEPSEVLLLLFILIKSLTFQMRTTLHQTIIQRFFSKDGIHLTRSNVKRLLDAINRNINIVVDYNFSVFNGPKYRGYSGHRNGSSKQGQSQRKSTFDRRNKQCYECALTGHIASEC